jgi:hypothetical protein
MLDDSSVKLFVVQKKVVDVSKYFTDFSEERVFYCKVFGQIFNLKMRFSI